MKKILMLLLSCNFLFSADNNLTKEQNADNIVESASYGQKIVDEDKLESLSKPKTQIFYQDASTLNFILLYKEQMAKTWTNTGTTATLATTLNYPKEEVISNTNIATSNNTNETVIVKGYCLIDKDVYLELQPGALRTMCQTNAGSIVMFADLVAVPEQNSLLVNPRFIEKNKHQFKVIEAIITNEAQTSYNVATFVNSQKLETVKYKMIGEASNDIKIVTNQYLKALEESKRQQRVDVITSGNNIYPIQTTNTEKPEVADYAMKAGVEVMASSIKAIADSLAQNRPYIFEITSGSKIWIDLKVEKRGERI